MRDWGVRHLPANWNSTAFSNEVLAFVAKDAILVIDDFVPSGTHYNIQKLHGGARLLLRGQGNHWGGAQAACRGRSPSR